MKPKELPRKSPNHSSFSISEHILPHFLNVWHYHKEIELVYIQKSTGTRFIGDSIKKFRPGDLVLIGSELPHLWLNGDEYFNNQDEGAEAIVTHFHPACFGDKFFDLPELDNIRLLLEKARLGLKVKGECREKIIQIICSALNENANTKLVRLIEVLILIAENDNNQTLATQSFLNAHQTSGNSKLDSVYAYIYDHFKEEVTLEQVASIANMNPSSFSRYFKHVTNKTFIRFLNEIRVGYASKMILEDSHRSIAQIGFESGYHNISNFNKQFKQIKKLTPKEYQRKHFRV